MRKPTSARWLDGGRFAAVLILGLGAQAAFAVPSFTSTPVTAVNEDASYVYEIRTTDPQSGQRQITGTVLPSWLSLSNANLQQGRATLSGTPTQAQVGVHAVTLTVRNLTTNSTAMQSFSITVANVNDAPTFTSTPVTAASEDALYTYSITTADPDTGGTRTVSAPTLPSWLALTNVTPATGTATLSGTPTQAQVGTHSVTLRVTDNGNPVLFTNQTFTITVSNLNDAPTFTSTPVTAADEDAVYTYNITTADPDTGGTRTVSAPTPLPSWLTLTMVNTTAGTARLTGTPTQAEVGTHSVTLRVTDNGSPALFATQTFTITVANVNDAPTFTSTPVTAASQGALYTYNVTTADADTDNTRTISAPTPLPAWLALTNVNATAGTATLSGTPTQAQVGIPQSVTLRVTDNGSPVAFTNQTFTITVGNVNDAPVITGQTPNPLTTAEDTPITIQLTQLLVTDPDLPAYPQGFTLTVLASTNYTVVGSVVQPAPDFNGTLTVPVRVSDGTSNSNVFNLQVAVTPVNDPPRVLGAIPPQFAAENVPFQLLNAAGAPTTLAAFFRDVDVGDVLTYQVTGLPPSGRIVANPSTGAITGTPLTADTRDTPYVIQATASDDRSLPTALPTQTFNLTIAALNRADVSLAVAAGPTPTVTNTNVDWTFTIANAGPQVSAAINLTAEFAGNPFSFTQLGNCSVTPAGDRQLVSCTAPVVAAGGSTQLVISGRAAQAGDVNVTADARGAVAVPVDPNPANNSVSATVNIAQTLSTGPAQQLASPDNTAAAAGDLNGDGFIDLALTKSSAASTELYLNVVSPANPAQRGLAETPLTVGDTTPSTDLALADLDNDRDLDLVTTNGSGQSNNVFLNSGTATFTPFATLGAGNSHAVAAADFNGDGLPDLAFANSSPNTVYLNGPGVVFALRGSLDNDDSRDVLAADLDLDGLPDLVFANANGPSRFSRNLGAGQFANGVVVDNGGAQAVASGDFNGDGRPDLVLARTSAAAGPPSIVVYQNNPGGPASPLFVLVASLGAAPIVDLATADVDFDGSIDIIAVGTTGTHQVYRGNGAGGFSLHPVQFSSPGATGAALGKFSVDDRVDLAVGGTAGTGVFFNDGRGGLGPGDTERPVIALSGEASVTITVESAYQDAGATATDQIDGNLTARIVTRNPVNPAIIGTYTVTYDVTDNSGNAATRVSRSVRVAAREGTGGGGGGAVGAPAVLGLLFYLFAAVRRRSGRRPW